MRQSENKFDHTPPQNNIKALAPFKNKNQIINTEPDGKLYILAPNVNAIPSDSPHKKQIVPAGPQTPLVPVQIKSADYQKALLGSLDSHNNLNLYTAKISQNINNIEKNKNPRKKPPTVKSLVGKFKKNGLGLLDSYFNAYFFYYEWKSEKKGRKLKEEFKTVAKHPVGWGRQTNESVYEKNTYDKYLSRMTNIAKLSGIISSAFIPVKKFFANFKNIGLIIKNLFGFLVPATAVALTAMTIININSFKPQLALTLNGQEIGFVVSKETVGKAVIRLENTVAEVLNEPYEFSGNINYRIILSDTGSYVSENELYNIMYDSSQNAITQAYGLYIDGELVGAAENESDINRVLNEVLENIAAQNDGETVEFANEIKIIEDKYPVRDVISQDELKNIIAFSAENPDYFQDALPTGEDIIISDEIQLQNQNQNQAQIQSQNAEETETSESPPQIIYDYEIIDWDVPLAAFSDGFSGKNENEPETEAVSAFAGAEDLAVMAVAASLNLTPEAVNAIPRGFLESITGSDENVNPRNSVLSLLSKASGSTAVSSIQLKKTRPETYTVTVPFDIKYIESYNYYVGTQVVQKNGSDGEDRITANVTYIGDTEVSREIIEIETIKEVVDKVIVKGIKPKPQPGPTGGFIRPVRGGYVTTRFGAGHRGIDFVVPYGTPVGASDGGTVIYAGVSKSYGNHVKIRHSDGFVTLYAHLSSISVKTNDKVFQGQEVGKVGSTGNSSGNHLHFEIIKNGVLVNPDAYMK